MLLSESYDAYLQGTENVVHRAQQLNRRHWMMDYIEMGMNQIPDTWCDMGVRLPFFLQEQIMRTAKYENKVES
jgi:hypothetical protein